MSPFLRRSLLGVALLSCLALASMTKAEKLIKFASIAPERSHWGKALTNAGKLVANYSKNSVKIRGYHGGVQGDERAVLRKIRTGQLQGAVLIGQGVSEICPDSLVLNLPFFFDDLAEARFVADKLKPDLEASFRKRGYEVLAWPELGFSELYSREKVNTLEQFRKCKPWLIENDPLSKSLFEVLKTQPVSTGAANVLTGLQSGLLKTVFTPPAGLITLQWHSRVKYRIDASITYAFGVVIVDSKTFASLNKKEKNVLVKVFQAIVRKLNVDTHKKNTEALAAMAKAGIETVQPDAAFEKSIRAASEEVARKLSASKEFSPAVLEKARKFRDEYRRSKD